MYIHKVAIHWTSSIESEGSQEWILTHKIWRQNTESANFIVYQKAVNPRPPRASSQIICIALKSYNYEEQNQTLCEIGLKLTAQWLA